MLRPRDLDRFIETASVKPGMRLVMNFGEVRFLSGDFLGGLLNLKKKLAAVGGEFRGSKIAT